MDVNVNVYFLDFNRMNIYLVSLFIHLVNVIVEVRDELLEGNKESEELGVWSGDPCLPVGWPGVSCESMNGTYVIKML